MQEEEHQEQEVEPMENGEAALQGDDLANVAGLIRRNPNIRSSRRLRLPKGSAGRATKTARRARSCQHCPQGKEKEVFGDFWYHTDNAHDYQGNKNSGKVKNH